MSGYVTERNKLIPAAEKHANKQVGETNKPGHLQEDYRAEWNFCFHQKMNQLWEGRNTPLSISISKDTLMTSTATLNIPREDIQA